MIEIRESDQVPDSTYFRVGSAEPDVNADGSITIYNGQGTRRSSWGAPGITSTVIYRSADFVAVHVGFHHKHGGGQTWRYYRTNGDDRVQRLTWSQLDDELRAEILDACGQNAPNWAKAPGKLRKDYKRPDPKARAFTGYKVMRVEGDTLESLYDPRTTYELGTTRIERSRPYHNGGYYVVPKLDGLKERFLAGNVYKAPTAGTYAIVECECWGNREYYAPDWVHPSHLEWFGDPLDWADKIAVTYCKPLTVIETITVE